MIKFLLGTQLRPWHVQALGISISNTDKQNKLNREGVGTREGKRKKEGKGGRKEGGNFLYFTASEKRPSNFIEEYEIQFQHSVHAVLNVFQGIIIHISPHGAQYFLVREVFFFFIKLQFCLLNPHMYGMRNSNSYI